MPLLNINVIAGRTQSELSELLEAAHSVVVDAFDAPQRDRYQIVHELQPTHFVMQDTGLEIARSDNRVLIEVTSRPRTREQKETFYRLITERLRDRCGIEPSDVMVTIVENEDEDWSFGLGRAQFLTGDL